MFRRIVPAATVLVAIGLAVGSAHAQSLKVGVFDSQRVSIETVEGSRVQAELTAITEVKKQELGALEREVLDLQDQLNKQALSLSPDRRAQIEVGIQRKQLEINNARDLATRELQLEIGAAEQSFNEKLRAVVEQVARDEEFSLILEYGAVAWAAESIDLTTAIIDRFNQMFPGTAAAGGGTGD